MSYDTLFLVIFATEWHWDGSMVPRFTKNEVGANAPASFFQYASGYLQGTIEPSPGTPHRCLYQANMYC